MPEFRGLCTVTIVATVG